MTWFNVDDTSPFNAKVLAAGNEAWGAYCRVGAHCAQQLTDGRFEMAIALAVAPDRVWKKLVDVRLVDRLSDDILQIHNYLKRNPSRAQVMAKRDANKARVSKYRKGDNATGNGVTSSVTNSVTPRQTTEPQGVEWSGVVLGSAPKSDPEPTGQRATPPKPQIPPPPPEPESGFDVATRVWVELWQAKYKRIFVRIFQQDKTFQQIAAAAEQQDGDREATLRHWVKSYLRDQDKWLLANDHPLAGLLPRVGNYGAAKAPQSSVQPVVRRQEPARPAPIVIDMQELAKRAEALSKAGKKTG